MASLESGLATLGSTIECKPWSLTLGFECCLCHLVALQSKLVTYLPKPELSYLGSGDTSGYLR